MPDSVDHANQNVDILEPPLDEKITATGKIDRREEKTARVTLQVLSRAWTFRIGVGIVSLMLLAAIFAPILAPYDPQALHIPLQPWFTEHLFGTDALGHDILSQMLYGTRVSFLFAFGAAGISLLIGTVVGAIPAYRGGWTDDIMARVYEIILMIPQLFLIIAVVVMVGANVWFVVLVIGLTIWPTNAKIMRAQVLSVKRRLYVDAAVVGGRRPREILFRHIVPNSIGPVIANSTLQMAQVVMIEAGLSFLGLSDPQLPSWGYLLNQGQDYIGSAPWMVVLPGLALATLLLSLHLVGDGVAKALDPRSH